jgi:hypothetical protein
MTSRRTLASPAQRRAILQATLAPPDQPLFGEELTTTRWAAFLPPGAGQHSLASVLVPGGEVSFTALWREGALEPDFRARLPLPGLGERILPVKDHFLLRQAELSGSDLDAQVRALTRAIRQMGPQVVVRLGLSRAFQAREGAPGQHWLMADGFFSLEDPQP